MSDTSVFTDYLKVLADYSERVDKCEVTNDDFGEFQQLKDRITKAYQRGYYKKSEYEALNIIYFYLHDAFREVLKLDPPEAV